MKPALAMPFFTGVVAFIGNIISLTKSIQNWQDAIVNKVLEELEPLLNRIKPSLIGALDIIIAQIDRVAAHVESARTQINAVGLSNENSPLAMLNRANLVNVQTKLKTLKQSIENNDISGVASNLIEMKDDTSSAIRAVQSARAAPGRASGGSTAEKGMLAMKDKVGSELSAIQDKAKLSFRKLNESEMVVLLRSLWTSIRWMALMAFMFYFRVVTTHEQGGTRPFRAQHHNCSRDIFAVARPIPSLHLHRHRYFFRWQ